MPNRLASETSPYLLQHLHNPVEWYPWGPDALNKAKSEQKPIFLSIGYAACHWCHVMAHESFEDPRIAGIMNEHFINIKVDREERPDLDAIYMNAVVSMTGHGGWPMSVFLTPQGEPFFGGTYFPPARRFNMPSFEEILLTVARLWREEREDLLKSGKTITEQMLKGQQAAVRVGGVLDPGNMERAALRLAQSYDWNFGGWGQAPKFPQPMAIEFLLRRGSDGDRLSLDTALHALLAMSKGGMYDTLGGGFSRYSTDNDWLVPHFEKMLYDNALLSRLYLFAYVLTGSENFLAICRETLDFLQRELGSPQGGFYSSLDADSEGVEGKFYLWSFEEIQQILQEAQAAQNETGGAGWAEVFCAAFGVTISGNHEGMNVLQRSFTDEELAERFQLSVEQVSKILAEAKQAILSRRSERVRPGTDDKVLVAWNAFALATFAVAARYLKDGNYLAIARKNASFLIENLWIDGALFRSWREGHANHRAYLEDYASLALALLELYQTDFNPHWYQTACKLTESIEREFADPAGGYFDALPADGLLFRPKDIQDNAVPSGNSVTCRLLGLLSALNGDTSLYEKAAAMAAGIQNAAERYPTAFANWLCAEHFLLGPIKEIALLSASGKTDELTPFTDRIWSRFRPNLVLAASQFPPPQGSPDLLHGRPLLNQNTTAFVCENFTCRQPVNSVEDFYVQLEGQPDRY